MTFVLLMSQLGLVLVVAMVLGHLAERIRLPAIAGQLLAGVILGPTVLGTLWPSLYGGLFPSNNPALKIIRTDFLQIGLLLFIFFVGLEINLGMLRKRLRTIVPTSFFGMIVPFLAGFAAVIFLPQLFAMRGHHDHLALPFIIAVALSISALPVIAAIISDLGVLRTHLGQIILSAAVIDDLCGWLGFAAVAAAFAPSGHTERPLWMIVLIVLGGFALALTAGRKMGNRLGNWIEHHKQRNGLALGGVLAITLMMSAIMEGVGAHAFFGALIVGLSLSGINKKFLAPIEKLVRSFFVPLYFGAIGLSLNFLTHFDLVLCLVVLAVACLGKLVGVGIGTRLGGCTIKQSLAIASGMNARGAIEILLATLALSVGLIDGRIFVAITIMAIVTSIMAGFFLHSVTQTMTLQRLAVPALCRLRNPIRMRRRST